MSNSGKRFLSLLLCLSMLLSFVPTAVLAADTVTIYCQTPGWTKCNVYFWSSSDTTMTSWPGEAMTLGEDGIWYYEVPVEAENVIFNNGSSQTANLTMPTDENVMYVIGNDEWMPYTGEMVEIVYSYYVAGDEALCGSDWLEDDENNRMTEGEEGIFTKVYENVAAGTYELKVTDGTWYDCWGDGTGSNGNSKVVVTDDGSTVTVTFNHTTHKVTTAVTLPAGGCQHEYEIEVTGPTCQAQGYTTYTCTLCGNVFEGNYTDMVDHSYGADSLCTYCGVEATYYVAGDEALTGSDWLEDDENNRMTKGEDNLFTKIFTNVAAGTYELKVTDGTWYDCWGDGTGKNGNSAMTVTDDGSTVTVIFDPVAHTVTTTVTVPDGRCEHSYESVVTAPTCTEPGYTTHTCTLCGDTYTDSETAATGHSYVDSACEICGALEFIASGTCGKNLTWTLDAAGTLTISGEGEMENYTTSSTAPWYLKRTSILRVIIEDGVTSIGLYAFYACLKMESVSVGGGVKTIGDSAFKDCSKLKSVRVPDSVIFIGADAFYNCIGLSDVTLSGALTDIGHAIFYNCASLTNITIPEGVTYIEQDAFSGCTSLTAVTIPEGVVSIRDNAFSGCTSLDSITIPSSLSYVSYSAFAECRALEHVYIDDLEAWLNISFHLSASTPLCYGAVLYVDGTPLTELTVPDSVATINDYVFCGCDSLTSVTIPEGVASIGDYAFYGCDNLTSVTIPEGVAGIGAYAFGGCTGLTSVTIPEGVISIGDHAFHGCTGLANVTILEGVASIEDYAFGFCTGLTNVTIPESVGSIADHAFVGCTGLTDVYYGGSKEAWNVIQIGTYNEYLTGARIHYGGIPACAQGYKSVVTAPTCTEQGYTTHTCYGCGLTYTDSETATIAHSYESVVTAPTCTEVGYTTHTCTVCGDSHRDSFVTAGNHSYESVVTDPSCTMSGFTTHTCIACGESYMDSAVPALGHSYGNWSMTVMPTCETGGQLARSCVRCLTQETTAINALGHSYESVVTPVTCTTDGYTTHTCANCGDSYTDSYITAPGHSFVDGTCETCGKMEPLMRYLQAPESWTQCYIHYWNDSMASTWPGDTMQLGENGIWYAEVPAEAEYVLFNNGSGTMSGNLAMATDGSTMYVYENRTWVPYTGERVEIVYNYYVAGENTLCGSGWVADDAANQMTEGENGIYTKVYENVPAGTYMLKVTNGTWEQSWGGDGTDGNYQFTVETESTVTIIFDSVNRTVSHTAEAVDPEVPDVTDPVPTEPDYTDPEVPDVTDPVPTEPEDTDPTVPTDPDYTDPEVPDVTDPVPTEPEDTDPEVPTDPELPEDTEPTDVPETPEVDYYVAGESTLCGSTWNPKDEANRMIPGENGIYTKVYENVPAGTYELKVTDGTWYNCWGETGSTENYILTVEESGDVTVIFDSVNCVVSHSLSAEPEDPEEPTDPTDPEIPVEPTDPTDPEIPVEPTDPTETEPVEPDFPEDGHTVYFWNTDSWSTVYLYTWSSSSGTVEYNGSWPGVAMLPVEGVDGLYYYIISQSVENVIFNNGSVQTADLPLPTDGRNLFTYSSGTWSTLLDHGVADDLSWTLDANGVLTVMGSGTIPAEAPWAAYNEQLTALIVTGGITGISASAFSGCVNVTTITFRGNAPTIDEDAFAGITATVYYPCTSNWTEENLQDYGGSLTWIPVIATGTCGENLTWVLGADGVLTISGTGDMYDYFSYHSAWYEYQSQIIEVIIGEGVTSLGKYAFCSCNAGSFTFLGDAPAISSSAFTGVYANVYYPADNATWMENERGSYGGVLTWIPTGEVTGLTVLTDVLYYVVGDVINPADLSVFAVFEDGNQFALPSSLLTLGDYDLSTPGRKTLTVSYEGCSTELTLVVHETGNAITVDPSLYPESKHDYENNVDGWQTLTVPGAQQLILTFSEDSYTESDFDYIYIKDADGTTVATLTGSIGGYVVTVPGDTVEIWLATDGSVTYYGYSFSSIVAKTLVHTGEISVTGKAPTCTEDGLSDALYCEICRQDIAQTVIPATGHSYDNTCDTDCNTCGEERTITHTYDNACDTACNVCGETRETEHMYDADCDTDCNICGAERDTAVDHVYENGFCTVCDAYQPAQLVDGVYQIGNAGQLYWFADLVNGGETTANAVLTGDIVVNKNVLNADGSLSAGDFRAWTPISYYVGTFDGNGYTISGLYFNDRSVDNVGLFATLWESAAGIVKNVGIVDSYFCGQNNVGSIVGASFDEVRNCFSSATVVGTENVGGIIGQSNGLDDSARVERCWNTGTVTGIRNVGGIVGYTTANSLGVYGCYNMGAVSGQYYIGGLVGFSSDGIEYCYNVGTVTGSMAPYFGSIAGMLASDSSALNSFYTAGSAFGTPSGTATNVELKTAEKFASGEVAYLLNGDQSEILWHQTIGEDAYPVYSGDVVYAYTSCDGTALYTNDSSLSGTTADHSYVDGVCEVCGEAAPFTVPTIQPLGPGLAFKDEIYYNIYFGVNNPDNVEIVEMGLLTWTSPIDGTIESAEYVCPGTEPYYTTNFKARTQSISAKNMGEQLYIKIYLKLADGTYVYSTLLNYSAKNYATNKINDANSSAGLKALCVALMNYGAAAQEYFGYKTDDLMNAGLTAEQQALAEGYSDTMIPALVQAGDKAANLGWSGGYSALAPSVSFGGALGINYTFVPNKTMDGDMKLYIWTSADETMTLENATEVITMTPTDSGAWSGQFSGIAAKNAGDTVYACGVYYSDGVECRTGVLAYSVSAYCQSYATRDHAFQAMAATAAVYTYYANAYLGN